MKRTHVCGRCGMTYNAWDDNKEFVPQKIHLNPSMRIQIGNTTIAHLPRTCVYCYNYIVNEIMNLIKGPKKNDKPKSKKNYRKDTAHQNR